MADSWGLPLGIINGSYPAMIRYALRCGSEHEFEAWFRDSAGYDEQHAAGEVACPVCGDSDVTKALMTPVKLRAFLDVSSMRSALQARAPQ